MQYSRRTLLVATGSLALAACSSSGTKGGKGTTATPSSFTLVQRFPTEVLVPGRVRLPMSIAIGGTIAKDGPATIEGAVLDSSDKQVTDVSAVIRNNGIETAYWAFRPDIAAPGVYTLRAEGDDGQGAAFQVFEPSAVPMPYTGATLPAFDTPTVDDHRGVEPYCSLTPNPCPLHAVTLTDALQSGKPVVYMVGTPAHCQTGTCAPGLEFLVTAHERIGDKAVMVHADVYADDAGTQLAPAVNALGLSYEPVIYLVGADGVIVDHLDGVWDGDELNEALDAFVA